MGDLLTANALLAAMLTILYTLWYSQIEEGINITVKTDEQANHGANYLRYKEVYWSKAFPLAVASIVLVAVNSPICYNIVSFALSQIGSHPRAEYDAVNTLYVVVIFLGAFLSYHTVRSAYRLRRNVGKMKPPRANP